jgi:hypothetical protein
MEMRSSTARSTVQELNGGEGRVQRLEEQLQGLAMLLDLCTWMEKG